MITPVAPFRTFIHNPLVATALTVIMFHLFTSAGQAAGTAQVGAPEIIPVWNDPKEDGVLYYHIPQVLVTKSGAIIACAEARYANGDGVKVDMVIRRSVDGGRTWSKSKFIERAQGHENYVLPTLVQERETGRIFFFCAFRDGGLEDKTTANFYRSSDDDGESWSEHVYITEKLAEPDRQLQQAIREGRAGPEFKGESPDLYGRGLIFFGPGRPIQLSPTHPTHPNRLVVPLFYIKDRVSLPRTQRGYGNGALVSDDRGATWRVSGIVPIGGISASEVSVVELSDGKLLFNSRETPDRKFLAAPVRRTVSVSSDGGSTWTRPQPDSSGIPSFYETHAGMLNVSDRRVGSSETKCILFSFPAGRPGYQPSQGSTPRLDGTVMASYDDHRSWKFSKVLVLGPFSYSNMDRLPDGTLVLVYGAEGGAVNFVRFTLDWLTDGRGGLTGSK